MTRGKGQDPWGTVSARHGAVLGTWPGLQLPAPRGTTPTCSVTEQQQRAKATLSSPDNDIICSWAGADLRTCSPIKRPPQSCEQQALRRLLSTHGAGRERRLPDNVLTEEWGSWGWPHPGTSPAVSLFLLLSFGLTPSLSLRGQVDESLNPLAQRKASSSGLGRGNASHQAAARPGLLSRTPPGAVNKGNQQTVQQTGSEPQQGLAGDCGADVGQRCSPNPSSGARPPGPADAE